MTIKPVLALITLLTFVPLSVMGIFVAVFRKKEFGWFGISGLLCAFLIIFALYEFPAAKPRQANIVPPKITPYPDEREIVYMTISGERYHKENCRVLGEEILPLFIEEAQAQHIEPCKICHEEK